MTDKHSVLFSTLDTDNGKQIAIATLNKPQALNALDLDMIELLLQQLLRWQQDDNICMVLLHSELDKAFCAGGDVVAMYKAMVAAQQAGQSGLAPQLLVDFFSREYQLDYLLHTYSKPVMVWGHGIVMGGGMGLMAGASHRIVTETSRIAMPEITIGLYPDVGGSYFLNRMPKGCGLFLGLSGASINATDALYCQLADYFIACEHKASLLAKLQQANWQSQAQANHVVLDDICEQLQALELAPKGKLAGYQSELTQLAAHTEVSRAVQQILALDSQQDPWLAKAQKTLQAGSPVTMHLVFEQLKRGQQLSLADCFRMELVMSCYCGQFGEFQEGVRALLVDKDFQPKWRYSGPDMVPADVVEAFFTSPWSATAHPLAQLGVN